MPRKKGTPKTGGRQAGTPNKKTAEVQQKLQAIGAEPLEGLARIAQWAEKALYDAETIKERIDCMNLAGRMYAELAEYEAPKRSRVDHGVAEGSKVTLVIEG